MAKQIEVDAKAGEVRGEASAGVVVSQVSQWIGLPPKIGQVCQDVATGAARLGARRLPIAPNDDVERQSARADHDGVRGRQEEGIRKHGPVPRVRGTLSSGYPTKFPPGRERE